MPNDDQNASKLRQTTEREILMGLFDAVLALAEKLTGERLMVYLKTELGESAVCGSYVAWVPKDQEAAR
jgi:hypothetical protein